MSPSFPWSPLKNQIPKPSLSCCKSKSTRQTRVLVPREKKYMKQPCMALSESCNAVLEVGLGWGVLHTQTLSHSATASTALNKTSILSRF